MARDPVDLRLKITVFGYPQPHFFADHQRLTGAQAKATARQIEDFDRKLATVGIDEGRRDRRPHPGRALVFGLAHSALTTQHDYLRCT
jgi:hypothetical protein